METAGFHVPSRENAVLSDRLLSVLLTLVLLVSLGAVATPGAAQSTGEINLTVQPASADVAPGQNQTYEVVVEGPDNGINGYEQVVIDVVDPAVANITDYELVGNGTDGPIDASAIQNGGATLNLSAALLDAAFAPASETTIATFDVEATGSAGQSTNLTFDEQAGFQDVADNNDTIYTVNTYLDATFSVAQPANSSLSSLDVAGQGADAAITEGANESIAANVTNVGGQTGTFDVSLAVDTAVSESQQVANVAPGETRELTFENVTGGLMPGEYNVTVSTDNDSVQGNLTVNEPSNASLSDLDVAGQGVAATIVEGNNESIAANVTNVGGEAGTFDVALAVGTAVSETQQAANVVPGETRELTFANVTGGLAPGEYNVTVSTDNLTLVGNLTVTEPGNSTLSDLNIGGQGAEATLTQGENVSIAANVTNVGGVTATFDVSLTVDTAVSESQQVANVAPGETRELTFENVTGGLMPGEYNVTVSTDNDSVRGNLTVNEPSNASLSDLDIAGQGVAATIVEGDNEPIAANVTNVGGETGTFDIALSVGTVSESQQVANVVPGETRELTFANATGTLGAGDYVVTVSTANDTIQGNLTVNEPSNSTLADLNISGQGTEATIGEGDNESIAANVTNVGGVTATFDVSLMVGTAVSVSQQVTNVAPGETRVLTFTNATGTLDAGVYEVSVSTDNDTVQGNLTVNAPSNASLSALDVAGQGPAATITEGDNESVVVNVTNVGGETGTFDVSLSVGTVSETQQVVDVAPAETREVTFANVTGSLGVAAYNVTVSTADDAIQGNLTVESALFVADYTLSATDLRVDQTLTANATVQNTGTENDTLSVPLLVDGQVVDSANVSVAGGSNETVTLSWDPAYGTASVTVADLAPTNVTVLGPDLTGNGLGATDTTGDGLLNDVDGDGNYTVADVQALFNLLGGTPLQEYADRFTFHGSSSGPVDIFDVQALFGGLPQ